MLVEIERRRIATVATPGEETAPRVALKMVVGDGLLKEGADAGWKDFRVHRAGTDLASAASIVVHVVSKEVRVVRQVQFWLARDPNGDWKIFDWQEAMLHGEQVLNQ